MSYLVVKELPTETAFNNLENIIFHQKSKNATKVYDKNNELIGQFYSKHHLYYPLEKIPKLMIHALISIEDKNYWDHWGFDLKAIIRAGFGYIMDSKKKHGASTITQQLVRHFVLEKEKTFLRKINEIILSIKLERILSKEKIIELYLNHMYFGNGAYGVGSASLRYFKKPLESLDAHEHALIAGLLQAPSRYNPFKNPEKAKSRQIKVLKRMEQEDYLSKYETKVLLHKKLDFGTKPALRKNKAPYFLDYISQESLKVLNINKRLKNQGFKIYTTLDLQLQEKAQKALKDHEENIKEAENLSWGGSEKEKRIEAAILSVDPLSGAIRAMIGGRNYSTSQFNRTTQARRQAGSAFKPLVYSLALKSGMKWNDVLYVSPLTLSGNYRPKNLAGSYISETTMLRAFYLSMNTPTVEVGKNMGITKFLNHAKKMGIKSEIKPEYGSFLGSSEVSFFDLTRMTNIFSNNGEYYEPFAIIKIVDKNNKVLYKKEKKKPGIKALSPELSYLMKKGMQNVLSHGTGRRAKSMSHFSAGKSGTSNGSKDNWFIGFTSSLITTVWVGSDDFSPVHSKYTGSSLALPIWKDFMLSSLSAYPSIPKHEPQGVLSFRINPHYGNFSKDGLLMWFLSKNVPQNKKSDLESIHQENTFRTLYVE